MGDRFNRFALRYSAAVICGLALLLLQGGDRGGPAAVLTPRCLSPWEMSKLGFWPVLAAWGLTGRLGRERRPLVRDLPAAILVPLGMTAVFWAFPAGSDTVCLGLWAGLLAAGACRRPRPGAWYSSPAAAPMAALMTRVPGA